MEYYLLMDHWVRTIAGCYAYVSLCACAPGTPTDQKQAEKVDQWVHETLERIRDQCTEW
jgi:hypothetical protein